MARKFFRVGTPLLTAMVCFLLALAILLGWQFCVGVLCGVALLAAFYVVFDG